MHLAGFAGIRLGVSIHDELYVKVVLLKYNHTYYGCITYDLVGIDENYVNKLKQHITTLNYNSDHFIISATHTHSAPCGTIETETGIHKGKEYIFGKRDETYQNLLIKQTLLALQEASHDLKKARIRISKDKLLHFGSNRNDKSYKGNNELYSIYIQQENGIKAIIAHYSCHPTVLNQTNTSISADFPGAINDLLNEQGYDFFMFLNGSCGDISTRFTRQNTGFEEVLRYGKLFTEQLIKMEKNAHKINIHNIQVTAISISLKLKQADDIEIATQKYEEAVTAVEQAKQAHIHAGELRIIEARKEGAEVNLSYAKNALNQDTYSFPIFLYQINNETFITIPGELYSELTNTIPNKHLHFICYTNGYLGYFADHTAYTKQYYEALSSPFEKGQSEYMMEIIQNYIK